jgi:hypothetical protein
MIYMFVEFQNLLTAHVSQFASNGGMENAVTLSRAISTDLKTLKHCGTDDSYPRI